MGNMARSRVSWLQNGEKPSKYFCTLEHQKYIDKTIKKVCFQNGKTIPEQVGILHYVKEFYANLFQSKDNKIPDINITETIKNDPITKLSESEAPSLEGPLKISELSTALTI